MQRFNNIDVRIIRRAYHTVSIPPPKENERAQQQETEPKRDIITEQEEHKCYECQVTVRGKYCGEKFKNKKALLCHMRFQHKVSHLIKCMVRTNECPYCRSTFASQQTVQQHAVQAIISKTCKTDQGHYNTPLAALITLECPLCEFEAKHHDQFQRHIIKHSARRPQYIVLEGQPRLTYTPPRVGA